MRQPVVGHHLGAGQVQEHRLGPVVARRGGHVESGRQAAEDDGRPLAHELGQHQAGQQLGVEHHERPGGRDGRGRPRHAVIGVDDRQPAGDRRGHLVARPLVDDERRDGIEIGNDEGLLRQVPAERFEHVQGGLERGGLGDEQDQGFGRVGGHLQRGVDVRLFRREVPQDADGGDDVVGGQGVTQPGSRPPCARA